MPKSRAVRFALVLASLAILAAASSAHAVVPETGFWWSPQQPGRGWTIEHQDGAIAVAHYVFDEARKPISFTSYGPLDADTGIADVPVLRSDGGTCYGCTAVVPTSSFVAQMRLTFATPTRGTLAFNGETIPIERFNYGYANPYQGAWVETTVGVTQAFGDALTITGPCASCTSIPDAFQGFLTLSPDRVLVGGTVPNTNLTLVLVDASASYYTEYLFEAGLDSWVGASVTYLKNEASPPNPLSAGLDFHARRVVPKAGAVFKSAGDGDAVAAMRAAEIPPSHGKASAELAALREKLKAAID